MSGPGGAQLKTHPVGSDPRPRALSWALVLFLTGATTLVGAAVLNGVSAPPGQVTHFADVIPLSGGTTATAASRIVLQGSSMIVTSHFVYDPTGQVVISLGNGPRQPLTSGSIDQLAVDGDRIVWMDLHGTPTLSVFDGARGTVRTIVLNASVSPISGTLAAGDGWVAWSFAEPGGRRGAAVLAPGAQAAERYTSARAENRTVAAILRTDLFFSKRDDGADLWRLNTTGGPEEQLAFGVGPGRAATGSFFVAWVNTSSERVEYFDVLDRIVELLPPPAGVTPQWVLADGLTILMGGTKAGLLTTSPRVEFYDFGVGAAHLYDSIGVDFDEHPRFGYADRMVVAYGEAVAPRPTPALVAILFVLGALQAAAALVLGLRSIFNAPDPP